MQAHMQAKQALMAERQALLHQQAAVLQEHVRAGHVMPPLGGKKDASGAATADRRQQLVAQLVQEEAAAQAALEALKQGCTLAKAREVGERVMQQAQDLQAHSTTPAGGARPTGKPQSVLLHSTTGKPGALDRNRGSGDEPGSASSVSELDGLRPNKQQHQGYKQEPPAVLASQQSLSAPTQLSYNPQQQQQHFLESDAAEASLARAGSVANAQPQTHHKHQKLKHQQHVQQAQQQQQQRQQQLYGPPSGGSSAFQGTVGAGIAPQAGVDAGVLAALQQQLATLQHAAATQQQQQQQQLLMQPGYPAHAPNPYTQPHSPTTFLQQQPPASWGSVPYSGQLSHMVAASPMSPAAAAGLMPPAVSATAAAAAVGPPADPGLAAAVAAHMRDMTLLRMDVERTRGAAELQQARADLAALQRNQAAGAAGDATGFGSSSSAAPAEVAHGVAGLAEQQQQQQQHQQALGLVRQDTGDSDTDGQGRQAQGPAGEPSWLAAQHSHSSSNEECWPDHDAPGGAAAAAGADALLSLQSATAAAASGASSDQEVLCLRADGMLAAARGSGGDASVLQVHVTAAGPFNKRGTYRVAVVLYDGFQPMAAGPGCQVTASTGRRVVGGPQGGTEGVSADTSSGSSASKAGGTNSEAAAVSGGAPGVATFHDALSIKGLPLSASLQLVFELYCAKPSVAGLPTKEVLVAWAATPLLQGGQVTPGLQSLPLLRLPILLTPDPVRHWSYEGALIDFRLARYAGAPGDIEPHLGGTPAAAGAAGASHKHGTGAAMLQGGLATSGHEDLPGVPAEAWVRVARGLLPSEPYTQGDGIVVVVDGARFLPACVTISRVVASVWSSSGLLLAGPFKGLAQPHSDALSPAYMCKATLDAVQSSSSFDDPTATLLMQVHTIERCSRTLRVVGFALLALFVDPRNGNQPSSRSIADYVLNTGAFQVPLHAGPPSSSSPLRMTSLDDVPRVSCASLLVRIMTPDDAKARRRKPPPLYGDRVYDSVLRCMPTALERKLYGRLLAARQPWAVREAARLVAWYMKQPGGLSGRRSTSSSSGGNSVQPSRRTTGFDAAATTTSSNSSSSKATNVAATMRQQQQQLGAGGVNSGGTAYDAGGSGGGMFKRLFGNIGSRSDGEEGGVGVDPEGLNTGDPYAAVPERQEDLEAAKAVLLPPSDGDIIDWMAAALHNAEEAAAALLGGPGLLSPINLNLATEYLPDLGFFVAVDGAMRLSRPLPAAAIISTSPPGSMYQDHPLVEEVRLTLDYDLDAPLSAPRWLDGFQAFTGLPYTPGLVLLLDVRCLVPGSSTASPAGWACLPVFEAAGPFVASGVYHLPLFQGIPSHHLLTELTEGGDPDAVLADALDAGRVRASLDCASVRVRLVCGSRQGQLEAPSWSLPLAEHRLTRHTVSQLGPGFVAQMRTHMRTRTYAQAKPQALTDEQWVDQINDTLLKISGVDEQLNRDGRED